MRGQEWDRRDGWRSLVGETRRCPRAGDRLYGSGSHFQSYAFTLVDKCGKLGSSVWSVTAVYLGDFHLVTSAAALEGETDCTAFISTTYTSHRYWLAVSGGSQSLVPVSWDCELVWAVSPARVWAVSGVSLISGRRPAVYESKIFNQLTS